MTTLGNYMRTMRVGHSYAQRWVAEQIGIDPRDLNEYEHDRAVPPVEVLGRLEECYRMQPGQFLHYWATTQDTGK